MQFTKEGHIAMLPSVHIEGKSLVQSSALMEVIEWPRGEIRDLKANP